MKKSLLIGVLAFLFSCDDGELQIERVDFEAVDVTSCGKAEDPTETTFFFKIDQDEALLLNLASGLLANETTLPGSMTSTIPNASKLIYRLFSDNVSQAYFCDQIPPLEPAVLKENNATSGDLEVDTKVASVTSGQKTYSHTITITNLSLTNDQNERITDSSTFVYGDFETNTANSANLELPFSNYGTETEFETCDSPLGDGTIRLYKVLNDEFITLDLPVDSLANVVTPNETPRTFTLEGAAFKYVVVDTLASPEFACTTLPFSEEITSWNFESTSGAVNITTTENEPDSEGNLSYTHTIVLEQLALTLRGDGADVGDAALNEIETVNLGSYITYEN
ncbi:hypothetical protein [Pareuzebyella sediminis]|uniref:hypothetical protein n=1 Tax=Pareuzebyella sediminis TaxID=2607998 RepID=UPI0011EFFB3C|nr:hypothetical protein [Pareuzebyella sediminis]